ARLCWQGEIAPGPTAELLPAQRPCSQGRSNSARNPLHYLGICTERLRRPLARAGIDPALAARFQLPGAAPPLLPRAAGSGPTSAPFPIFAPPPAQGNCRRLGTGIWRRADARGSAPPDRLLRPGRWSSPRADDLR